MHVLILGTRGIPSRHSGFETFAQDFALFLKARGHDVTVYCQIQVGGERTAGEDAWNGIRRILIPAGSGPGGTILFDWKAIRHSLGERGIVLTLGYNTACFNLLYRLKGMPNVMNMDGIEWKRDKWSLPARIWFWINERVGARIADHLVADHPEIGLHISRHTAWNKISVIPYGSDPVTSAPLELIRNYSLNPKGYYLLIARPEPENSILEIVRAFSQRRRGMPLVVLGDYKRDGTRYQKAVLNAAGSEVSFLGAIFDREIVKALRYYARAYFHGHRVGGTNPSLVESLAAGNAIIAHDNRFTRWVAGEGARYFRSADDVDEILNFLNQAPESLACMEAKSRYRYLEAFTQDGILGAYEELLLRFAAESPVTERKVLEQESVQGA
jgi:glycosyltransferase involved in cell wall biosynthesis